ncbi:hypothetical protein P7K49_034035, partial [Saguinus oedipus]
ACDGSCLRTGTTCSLCLKRWRNLEDAGTRESGPFSQGRGWLTLPAQESPLSRVASP